ncbi:hypothetical protein M436DRAFT_82013 [Aureobasidium namibiae CBS 147.97]|uniref:Uncharacterized protein n=1 Tax=Aureobasidium namibiae CBS 147.97 TaxID=1043004 RepID=A0A074WHZ3_9PEZI|nr:uncharacterized protein M436DRAFT_82013 [Aureobasidium namibiae CBS 147.97]KEQ72730.1 hypothetical protein M436DRAFT_82013 [Aureobasidium namibiae CBS 147.97]
MSCHIPGNISTYNEETAPLIDKLKQSYVPIDVKAAFNQLLEHLHNDELEACIDAGEELLKKRIPDTTCTRVHTLIASCLEDPDEMEEHYEKALNLWTLLNAEHANTRIEPWLREVRTQLDALRDAIQEERSDEITPELTMSAIAIVESAPTFGPSSTSSPDTSPARSSASSAASSALSATTNSRLSGAIASPGQQTLRLHDHLDMSPADILKLAWDPNRTIRGRTASSKTLPSRPFKRRASSTSQSTRGSTLPESASSESASSESASREIPSTPPPSTPSKTLPPTQGMANAKRSNMFD